MYKNHLEHMYPLNVAEQAKMLLNFGRTNIKNKIKNYVLSKFINSYHKILVFWYSFKANKLANTRQKYRSLDMVKF